MSEKMDNIINLVKPYGLSEEEVRLYLYLLEHGFCTALETSRELKISRTKIYRLLDSLKAKQLLETKFDERGMKFGATHPQKLQQLVQMKEQHIVALKNSLPDVITQLTQLLPNSQEDSKVLYYEGEEGLKQVSYNLTRTTGILRVYEMEHLSDFLSPEFAESIRQEFVQNGITTHDLTNKTSLSDFTKVTEMIQNFSEFRHVSPDLLPISFEVAIYNDVYVIYTYKDGTVFCVEIYNQQLADMQKQLFDFIWKQAMPLRFTSKYGSARVENP
jgi:sugar-specific transcriptional regulator TrmB